jgi:hypothetical protein
LRTFAQKRAALAAATGSSDTAASIGRRYDGRRQDLHLAERPREYLSIVVTDFVPDRPAVLVEDADHDALRLGGGRVMAEHVMVTVTNADAHTER